MDDMSEYKEMYAVESAEHLESMNEALLSLENDPNNSETINVMFRAAHTLKGMSATMGYSNIKELTHNMENLMDRVRKNEERFEGYFVMGKNESSVGPAGRLFKSVDLKERIYQRKERS
jgi:chemotaxis protein histidine kinase CheA